MPLYKPRDRSRVISLPRAVSLLSRFQRALILALLVLSPLGLPASAATDANVAEAIHSFLYEQTRELGDEVHIEILDTAARFPSCASPSPFLPSSSRQLWGRISVGVRCNNDSSSVRYIPVNIMVIGTYLTAASTINPGTVLGRTMLEVRQGDLSELPPRAVLDAEQAIGQLITRRLSPGTILQEQHLRPVPVVERGQTVTIESGGPGFVVRRDGEALESGGLGESIRVRISRRETMTGVIVGEGRVASDP